VKKRFAVVIFVALTLVLALVYYKRTPHFDEAKWKDSGTPASLRLSMADDLVASRRLEKLPRADVVKLLGEPLTTPYLKEYDMVYVLGPERGYVRVDSEWLVIKLSPSGHVEKAAVARD
jgi:hypothetical protein